MHFYFAIPIYSVISLTKLPNLFPCVCANVARAKWSCIALNNGFGICGMGEFAEWPYVTCVCAVVVFTWIDVQWACVKGVCLWMCLKSVFVILACGKFMALPWEHPPKARTGNVKTKSTVPASMQSKYMVHLYARMYCGMPFCKTKYKEPIRNLRSQVKTMAVSRAKPERQLYKWNFRAALSHTSSGTKRHCS